MRSDNGDFEEELRAHLEMLAEENVRRGMTPDEARRAARVRFGGVAQLQENHRELRGLPWIGRASCRERVSECV